MSRPRDERVVIQNQASHACEWAVGSMSNSGHYTIVLLLKTEFILGLF